MNDDAVALLQELQSFATYDPETGVFTATKQRQWKSPAVGEPLGTLNNRGYLYIRIGTKKWTLNVLAWLWMTKTLPTTFVNYIDGDKTNNRWINLRQATTSDIARNKRKQSNNTSGFTGVYQERDKWVARVDSASYKGMIGRFDTPEDAVAARKKWFKKNEQLGFTDRHGD